MRDDKNSFNPNLIAVIERRIGQSIRIGEMVATTLYGVDRERVRLGFEYTGGIDIHFGCPSYLIEKTEKGCNAMLVLSRRKGESLMIGEHIKLIVADIKGGQVRIAIDAPKEIAVHRQEIYELIHKEKTLKKSDYSGAPIIKINPI